MGDVGSDEKTFNRQRTAALAREIAHRLRREGLPMLAACEMDAGAKAAFAIRLPNGRDWAFRVPVENLTADAVRQMVEAYT